MLEVDLARIYSPLDISFLPPGLLEEVCHWSPSGPLLCTLTSGMQPKKMPATSGGWPLKTACQLLGVFPWKQEWHSNRQRFCMTQAEDRSNQGLLENHCLGLYAATWMWLRNLIQAASDCEAKETGLFVTAANTNYPN